MSVVRVLELDTDFVSEVDHLNLVLARFGFLRITFEFSLGDFGFEGLEVVHLCLKRDDVGSENEIVILYDLKSVVQGFDGSLNTAHIDGGFMRHDDDLAAI